MLYRRIDLPSDEPVQFVGVYTTHWGKADEPTVAFAEVPGVEERVKVLEEALGIVGKCLQDLPSIHVNDSMRGDYAPREFALAEIARVLARIKQEE